MRGQITNSVSCVCGRARVRANKGFSFVPSLQCAVHEKAITYWFFYPGYKSNRKQKYMQMSFSPSLCSDFFYFFFHHMYLNMNPWRRLLPLENLWGFQHHILTAISGTICFMLADITRLWTHLVLKCSNVLYVLILFSCGSGDIHRTQPTEKKKNYFLSRYVNQEGGK